MKIRYSYSKIIKNLQTEKEIIFEMKQLIIKFF